MQVLRLLSVWGGVYPHKSPMMFKKGMLSLDLVWIESGLSLDFVVTVEG